MKKFNPKSKCLKCGYNVVATHYCRCMVTGGTDGKPRCITGIGENDLEHLHRICERCEYEWLEGCI